MTEKLDAHKVVDNVVTALNTSDDDASRAMLQEVNEDLRKLSVPERDLVANQISLMGLFPDIAIETGLVSADTFVTKDALAKVANDEGSTSVQGMSAKFLAENFPVIGGGARQDINSDFVEGFDLRYDLALETAQAKREFGGLLDVLKGQNPGNADIQSRDGLQAGDIDTLLARPDQLTVDQINALKTMKNHFEYMKIPRGIWTLMDGTTPRVTESSLDEFVDTGAPLGMRDQLKIAEREKSKQTGLEATAKQAQEERLTPPAVTTDAPVAQPETPPIQTETPPVRTETLPAESEAPPAEAETPPAQAETPPAQAETPPVQTETPPADSETPPAQPEAPQVQPETPPTQPETPSAQPDAPQTPPDNTGDQSTRPESMERDKVTDKEIEVVKGDSLWKIARVHLTDKDGKRPSDAEVLKLVNQIVERNQIKNPDLIYPGEKFIIPGEAAPQKTAPETTPPTQPENKR